MNAKSLAPAKRPIADLAPLKTALGSLYRGFFNITHNSLALLGITLAAVVIVLSLRPDLRQSAEQHLLGWLLQRQEAVTLTDSDVVAYNAEPSAVERVTAAEPKALPKEQAQVALWLSRRYRVAPEPISALVAEAYDMGHKVRLEPSLILAVMAIESRFNPFAQSPVGAQGLMQVLTRVHTDKYEDFGGQLAAFDPMSNLRVGVRVLKECIQRAGSIEGGLRLYVGAVSTDGADYIERVMTEHLRIQSVAQGKPMPVVPPTLSRPSPTDKALTAEPDLEAEVMPPHLIPSDRPAKS